MFGTNFSPSLMCMDLSKVGEQLAKLDKHVDMYHIDIMDGHFCKNITLSPDFANMVAQQTELPLDVHLMVTQPADMISLLHLRSIDTISVHAETINAEAFRMLNLIHASGCRAGIVLNPATQLQTTRHYLGRIDLLTIMTVDVGFAGQAFIVEMLDKIREADALRKAEGYCYQIQIDGSCNQGTYKRLHDAGADVLVVGGSGLFKLNDDLDAACNEMYRQFANETGANL